MHLRSSPRSARRAATSTPRSTAAMPIEPDVAVILIGANDVTHTVLPAASVRLLSEAVRRLREAGVHVVVGTCPDLGTVAPLQFPLRQVGPAVVASAGCRPDHRGRGGRRAHGLPRVHPRPGVLRRAGPDVRSRPVPPLGRRLRAPRPHPDPVGPRGPRARRGRGGVATRAARRGRHADRLRRRAGEPEPRHRDRRHRGRRRQARGRRPLGHPRCGVGCCPREWPRHPASTSTTTGPRTAPETATPRPTTRPRRPREVLAQLPRRTARIRRSSM